MISSDSKSRLGWVLRFGLAGSLVATLLVVWFYLADRKEAVYPFLYYFGWVPVQINAAVLRGAERTASTARFYDVLYVLLTGLQWSLVGAALHFVFRSRKAS